MTQYLLSMFQPGEGQIPPPEEMAVIMKKIGEVREELQAQGSWVFGNGLHEPESSTVVRIVDGESITTDGPYIESKEHLGGLMIIDVEDLDAALIWAQRYAEITVGLPLEVRPFQG